MSSHFKSAPSEELNQTLYRHGLSIAVLFDLLVEKGILTTDEIRQKARTVNRSLLDGRPREESEMPDR